VCNKLWDQTEINESWIPSFRGRNSATAATERRKIALRWILPFSVLRGCKYVMNTDTTRELYFPPFSNENREWENAATKRRKIPLRQSNVVQPAACYRESKIITDTMENWITIARLCEHSKLNYLWNGKITQSVWKSKPIVLRDSRDRCVCVTSLREINSELIKLVQRWQLFSTDRRRAICEHFAPINSVSLYDKWRNTIVVSHVRLTQTHTVFDRASYSMITGYLIWISIIKISSVR